MAVSSVLVWLGSALALMSLLLLAIAPAGWRLGWWHFRFAFYRLMAASAACAAAAVLTAGAALVWGLGGTALPMRELAACALALFIGAVLFYVPWHYRRRLAKVPRIHDISTDMEDPPEFVAVMPARVAEAASSAAYEGDAVGQLQSAAYPYIRPLPVTAPPAQAFELALATARAMRGWTIVAADAAQGRIEASQTSRWFRFTDDIVVRVRPEGSGSRIDVRSLSRQGRSDFGVNAARIRAYLTALGPRFGRNGTSGDAPQTAASTLRA
jgi:uncharacterized protein (DUF1499 family)